MKKTNKLLLSVSFLLVFLFTISMRIDPKMSTNAPSVSLDRPGWEWSEFSPNSVVSMDSDDTSRYVTLAVNHYSGEVYTLWADLENSDGESDWDIYANTYGVSWGGMGIISDNSDSHSYNPTVECDSSGNIYFAWNDATDDDAQGDADIYFGNSSFGTEIVISSTSSLDSVRPDLILDASKTSHFVWEENDDADGEGDSDIFYANITNSGTLSIPTDITSESDEGCYLPMIDICLDENFVGVVFGDVDNRTGSSTELDLFYKSMDLATFEWSDPELISFGNGIEVFWWDFVIDKSGNVFVVWTDIDGDLFYARRDFISDLWLVPDLIAHSGLSYPCIEIDDWDNIYIAWSDTSSIKFVRWESQEGMWTTVEEIFDSETMHPMDMVFNEVTNELIVVWSDGYDWDGLGGFDTSDGDILSLVYTGENVLTPKLAPVVPAVSESGVIALDWVKCFPATNYYVFRDTSMIWSTQDLDPIVNITTTEFVDNLTVDGTYYYVVVAGNSVGNSTLSNNVYVTVQIPSGSFLDYEPGMLEYLAAVGGLLVLQMVFFGVSMAKHKKKSV